MEDYIVRYGYKDTYNRTDYKTLEQCKKQFKKFKADSRVTWAEIIYEPLDNEEETQIIDSFKKQVINVLGKEVVINIQ